MELSNTHVAALNLKLPAGFIIEALPTEEFRVKQFDSGRVRPEIRFHTPSTTLPPYRADRDTAAPKTPKPDGFRKIYGILQKLKSHPSIGPFLHPVDKQKTPDYYDIIHCPIDLSRVERKLMSEEYSSSKEFAADVRKMWSNSFLYNSRGTEIYIATIDLSAYFENLIKGNEDISLRSGAEIILPKIVSQSNGQSENEFSDTRKKQLGARIKMLNPKYFKGIYDIVKNATGAGAKGDEFEFDIDLLPPDVCRRLDEYTTQCLSASFTHTPTAQTKAVTQVAEDMHSDSEEPSSAADNLEAAGTTDNIDATVSREKSEEELWIQQKSEA